MVGQTTDTQLITLPFAIVYGVIADLWAHQLLLKEHSNELESLNIMFITGWSAQLANFLFLKRRWEEDEKEFHDKLLYLNSMNCPCQLLLFPEGGDITHKTKKRSDKYADENCLPRYQYCLHPRTTGFIYVMNALRSGGLDAVYDVTIGYPDALPKTEVELAKGIMPREVHFHIKSYDDGDLPGDDEQLGQWCKDRWLEKEERLKQFYTHKEFRDTQSEEPTEKTHSKVFNKAKEVLLPKNYLYLLCSVFYYISLNYFMYHIVILIPYRALYFSLAFLAQLLVSLYGGGLDKIMLYFKRREIKEASAKMKAMKEGKISRSGHSNN